MLYGLNFYFLHLLTLYRCVCRFKEAEAIYTDLLKRNSENVLYYAKLLEAKQIESNEDKVSFFDTCRNEYAGAAAPRRLQLNFATGDSFRRLVDQYLRTGLNKGVPPLFVDLRFV